MWRCWFEWLYCRKDEVASPTTPEMPVADTATVGTSGTAEAHTHTSKSPSSGQNERVL